MTAASLLCDLGERPAPVVGRSPVYTVEVLGRQRLLRSVVTEIERKRSDVGSCKIGFPLWVAEGNRRVINPGMVGLTEGSDVSVYRDVSRRFFGFVEQAPDIDFTSGWVTLSCRDHTEDINRTTVGTGSNEWKITDPEDPETPPEEDPVLTGWTGVNATVGSVSSPWGPGGITVGMGTDKRNTWHFAVLTYTLRGGDKLKLSARVNFPVGSSKKRAFTIAKRHLSNPNKAYVTTVSAPADMAEGYWSNEFSLGTLEGTDGVQTLYNIAFWAPITGARRAVVRGKLTSETSLDDDADPEVPQVKVGGDSAEMVSRLMRASAARSGGGWVAVTRGGGVIFDDGMKIEPTDTGTHGSHINTWSSTVEWRWNPQTNTAEVAGLNALAGSHPAVRASITGRSRVVGIKGAAGARRYTTVVGSDEDRSYALTFDSGSGRGSDRIIQAPANTNFETFARVAGPEAARPGVPAEVRLGAPPGGRTAGDWLDRGVDVCDFIPASADAGSWSLAGSQRITALRLSPVAGDDLTLTLEPA